MEYIVFTGASAATRWWLRKTVWTGSRENATAFPTWESAQRGLEAARRFMKPAAYRAARIVEKTEA